MLTLEVAGYRLAPHRLYDPQTHMWVELRGHDSDRGRHAWIGMDPLGRETSGDVVALSLEPCGTQLTRGDRFGDMEAAKFVGPLITPVSGVMMAVNDQVLAAPGLLNGDPMAHWLVEVALEREPSAELGELLTGPDALSMWFEAEVLRFRTQGAIAE